METDAIINRKSLSNYEKINKNWSKARGWTVNSLYDEWRGKDNYIFIFDDNRLEGENLAMLKWKVLSNLEKVLEKQFQELSENKKKIERYETILEVINDMVKKNNLEQNKEILEKILKLS